MGQYSDALHAAITAVRQGLLSARAADQLLQAEGVSVDSVFQALDSEASAKLAANLGVPNPNQPQKQAAPTLVAYAEEPDDLPNRLNQADFAKDLEGEVIPFGAPKPSQRQATLATLVPEQDSPREPPKRFSQRLPASIDEPLEDDEPIPPTKPSSGLEIPLSPAQRAQAKRVSAQVEAEAKEAQEESAQHETARLHREVHKESQVITPPWLSAVRKDPDGAGSISPKTILVALAGVALLAALGFGGWQGYEYWQAQQDQDPAPPAQASNPVAESAGTEKEARATEADLAEATRIKAEADLAEAARIKAEADLAEAAHIKAEADQAEADKAEADLAEAARIKAEADQAEADKAAADLPEATRVKAEADKAEIAPPESIESIMQRAAAKARNGDKSGAITAYSQAISADNANANAYTQRGILLIEAGETGKAIADFSAAIRYREKDPQAYFNRASAYRKASNWAAARADLDQVIALDGKNASAYNARALVWVKSGDYEQALIDSGKALERDPKNVFYCGTHAGIACKIAEAAKNTAKKAKHIDVAFAFLQQAIDNGFANEASLKSDRTYVVMHGDERWEQLLARIAPKIGD